MFAVYRLTLTDPAHPPTVIVERLRQALDGVEIGADGHALVFMSEDPDLGAKVRSAVERVCGEPDWTEHFASLGNATKAT
jgi:hypothetical protein